MEEFFTEGKITANKEQLVKEFKKYDILARYYDEEGSCTFTYEGKGIINILSEMCLEGVDVEMWGRSDDTEQRAIVENGEIVLKDVRKGYIFCRDKYSDLSEIEERYGVKVQETDFDEYGFVHIGGFERWGFWTK